ncbi:2-amino-4-hydroxy-6-hydroxymethyldihydropteridine pyrophosphokinase [compost metagenome]
MQLDRQRAYLLLGSNLGNREEYIERSLKLIAERIGEVVLKSSSYETAAWGKTDQPNFLNLAIAVDTQLSAEELLTAVLAIEHFLGRVRIEKWAARLIDIDIILYGNEVIDLGSRLQIPHREMQYRKFVMLPLVEIAPNLIHPILGKSMTEILSTLEDTLSVFKQ